MCWPLRGGKFSEYGIREIYPATHSCLLWQDPGTIAAKADDLLRFLYRIRDALPSVPFPGLAQLLHALESDPDSVFTSEDRRRMLIEILQRLSSVQLRTR